MSRPLAGSLLLALLSTSAASAQQTIDGCQIFPASNVWNTPVLGLPVHPKSADYIATMGAGTGLHMDFGSGDWLGGKIGIPYDSVPVDQSLVEIDYEILGWADESDPGPFPIPPDPQIEGEPDNATGDRHILVVRQGACELFELYYAYPEGEQAQALNDNWPDFFPCTVDGGWCAASGARYDLGSNVLRPDGWTSADAAGLPILPGLARLEEVEAGEIRHALRFTTAPTQGIYVWPARHQASSSVNVNHPPMGIRVRLKADSALTGYSPHARRILTALKRYGMILADNGSDWFISGVPNEGWVNDVLHELDDVTGSDFEVVDASSLMLDPDSGDTGHLFSDGFENEVTAFAHWSSHTP